MDFFFENIYTIMLFPIWIFLIISIGKFFGILDSKPAISGLTLISTLWGLIFSIGILLGILHNPNFSYESSITFLKIEDYALNLGVYVDNIAAVMLILVTGISFIVQLYSSVYMKHDASYPRFFAYLNLFNFSMLGLVLSSNLFQTYVFWELVGVSSYLLIGFWYKKPSASKAAKKAFIMNRIGDFGLLAGVISLSYFMYQYSGFPQLATIPFASISDIADYLFSYTNDFVFITISIFMLMGAIAKSAQFPLHTWLADAMEGPTPVSALIHSATMVAAGVFLVARLYPIFVLNHYVMDFIAIVGLITALICAYFAITQTDFKRILAYSTNSQLGLMFLALGAGAFTGGLFHLVTHAFFKSMLFLCSGIVIHSVQSHQDVRFMGGMRKVLPITALCYLIGCVAISGLCFSGFYSKELIINAMLSSKNFIYVQAFLFVSLMTAFYMFRSYFLVFEGKYRGSHEPEKQGGILNISILILAIFTVFLGYFTPFFEKIIPQMAQLPQIKWAVSPAFVSISIGITGFLFAWIFYNSRVNAFKLPLLYKLSYNRFYIDDLYGFIADKLYYWTSRICSIIDKYLVDGVVILSALCTRAFSWTFSKMQTGNFQSYLAYTFAFLAFAFTVLMFAYTAILSFGLLSGY
ncbi:MAG TPA: NADH-quinone oxidoreductase subunit L [Candidatus Gastranaerophilaceae bacterium]|nr:NADH-quinone oxidoreductase subunit L [Candidatus Gastranaerophilaceae bacterium]HPT42025.1 NADH-quinone oxidoreductase subunit L [Candidatus Gastranaerophilaceae bacterium]